MPDMLEIVPHDRGWASLFAQERDRLAGALGSLAVRIDHHGSTAVRGLAAKPVIDIQVSVRGLQPLEPYATRLAALGYVHVPHVDDAVCPFFHRPAEWPHTHHVHLVEAGGAEERRTLAFRDYLRDHPDSAREYESLKRELASTHGAATWASREAYAAGKTLFVVRVTDMALAAGYPRDMAPPRLRLPIETRRLLLRDFTAGDYADVHRYESDPDVMQFMFHGPRTRVETRDQMDRILAAQQQSPRAAWELALVHRQTGRVIGSSDLTMDGVREADLGYLIARDMWGHGYAAEAASAMVRAGFEQLALERIYALCDVDHLASARVLEKAGLRYVTTLERHREAKGRWWNMRLYELQRTDYLRWRTES